MSSSVEKIKERLSITDVVSSYIKLEKSGASYKAKCPFHNEKTPSFYVSPDRGTYYCFGCGAKGDIFSFVEQFEGLEFKQALANLANRAGIELVPENKAQKDEREELFRAVELTVEFFEENLGKNTAASEYLKKRGLADETIKSWRLGYADDQWHDVQTYLKSKGVSDLTMLQVGLIKKNEAGQMSDFYDVFRGRIMFPIFDQQGRPVAFSGRQFVENEKAPKYLNSPATPLFNKSETLYGLDKAKSAIRKFDYAILVEGQMDLIMSHQAGLVNTIASSGTALTEGHLRRLMRISTRVMFAFDSDSAGFEATKRSAELALRLGMEVKVVVLPRGEDPASLVLKSPDLWRKAIRDSKHMVDFYIDTLISTVKNERVLSREIKANVLPLITNIESSTEQAHFVKTLSDKTGLKETAIWDDLKKVYKAAGSSISKVDSAVAETKLVSRQTSIENRIMGVILWQETKGQTDLDLRELEKRFVEILGADRFESLKVAALEDKDKLIFEAEQYYEHGNHFMKDLDELFINLEEEILKEALSKQMVELHKAELIKDHARAEKFLIECQSINSRLAALKKRQ